MSTKNRKPRCITCQVCEVQLLTDLVEQNRQLLTSKLNNNVTNKKKNAVWREITERVNALGVANSTTTELKNKWSNIVQSSKKEYSEQKQHMRKTGGGPCLPPLSNTNEKVIDLYKDCPSFNGLDGVESPVTQEIIASPNTLKVLHQVLGPMGGCTATGSDEACTIEACTPSSSIQPADQTEFSMSQQDVCGVCPQTEKRPVKENKRRIKSDDITRMQYEVLIEQKKKLIEQTKYYSLKTKKLRLELGDI